MKSAGVATDNECVEYARECARLARLNNERLRDHLLKMSREWMARAMHETKMPRPKSRGDK
jgi:hypothetical protein